MELVEKNTVVVNDLHFILDTVDDHAIECIQDNYDNILKIKRTGFIEEYYNVDVYEHGMKIIHPFFDFVIEDDEVYYVDYGGMKRPIEKKKLKEIINDL